ncbi:small membrane protein YldA [Escherichia coli]
MLLQCYTLNNSSSGTSYERRACGITAFYIFIAAIIVAAVLYLEQRW